MGAYIGILLAVIAAIYFLYQIIIGKDPEDDESEGYLYGLIWILLYGPGLFLFADIIGRKELPIWYLLFPLAGITLIFYLFIKIIKARIKRIKKKKMKKD